MSNATNTETTTTTTDEPAGPSDWIEQAWRDDQAWRDACARVDAMEGKAYRTVTSHRRGADPHSAWVTQ